MSFSGDKIVVPSAANIGLKEKLKFDLTSLSPIKPYLPVLLTGLISTCKNPSASLAKFTYNSKLSFLDANFLKA